MSAETASISPRSALTSQTRGQQAAGPRRRPALAANLDHDVGDGRLGDLAVRVPRDHVVDGQDLDGDVSVREHPNAAAAQAEGLCSASVQALLLSVEVPDRR